MTCLFNARAYRDGSAAAPRRPDTSYWVYWAVVGLYVSTSFLVYRARGFRDGAPARVQGVPTAIAPLKDIEICNQYIFSLSLRARGCARGGRGVGAGPVPRGPIWDPIGGCGRQRDRPDSCSSANARPQR
jgi:hypothetical protein